jgi:hypothetical protein
MRRLLLVLSLLLTGVPPLQAQVSVSIGINLPIYPEFRRVPGYPVYYAPNAPGNYFFYDGLYWVFQADDWYASDWYNGPWRLVDPHWVPVYVLRVPVRYYRQAPDRFRQWRPDAPPRWGEYWGRDWEQRRAGWDRWDRRTAPAPAPLPSYQARYPQSRYPHEWEQQRAIRSENYTYRPRESFTREQYQAPQTRREAPAAVTPERRQDQRGQVQGRDRDAERERAQEQQRANERQREREREWDQANKRARERQKEHEKDRDGKGRGND